MAIALSVLVGLVLANVGRVVHAAAVAPINAMDASHVVVLGKHLSGGLVDADFQARLDRGANLMAADARRFLLISGGGSGTSEAAAGLASLQADIDRVLDPARIVLEEASASTRENISNIQRLLPPDTRPIVVSSRYHMARISRLADQANFPVHLVAAEQRLSLGLGTTGQIFKESIYLTALDIREWI